MRSGAATSGVYVRQLFRRASRVGSLHTFTTNQADGETSPSVSDVGMPARLCFTVQLAIPADLGFVEVLTVWD